MPIQLSICLFATAESLAQSLVQLLKSDRYRVTQFSSVEDLLSFVEQHFTQLDCLIVQNTSTLQPRLKQLSNRDQLLPTVIIERGDWQEALSRTCTPLYHGGEVWLFEEHSEQLPSAIEQAIAQFLQLAPSSQETPADPSSFISFKQHRLTEKLRERLGYLGVYYKRNPQNFFRNLPQAEKEKFLQKIRSEYRRILLNYFAGDRQVNQWIDQFVNQAFFADLSVSQIMEIHMDLIEQFSQQLKLEGRSEDILLDYRLTLIDVVAHLCEMYRRSIPREDLTANS